MEKPIVFIDLETTGVDVQKDRIIEICLIKVEYYDEKWICNAPITQRLNPTIPIPESATAIHGITNEMVSFEPTFEHVAPMILDQIKDCDIAGFNSNSFDLRVLFAEFERVKIEWDYTQHKFIDVGNMFKILNPRTLSAAFKEYTGSDHVDSHSAEQDTEATIDVFIAMMKRHEDVLPKTAEELALYSNFNKPLLDLSGKFTFNSDGEIVFNFGKHITLLAKNEKPYLEWMLKSDFASDTKRIIKQILSQ